MKDSFFYCRYGGPLVVLRWQDGNVLVLYVQRNHAVMARR